MKARGRAVPSKNVKVGVEEGASLVRLRPLCGLRGVETSLFGRGARGGNPSSEDDRSPGVINPLGRLKRFASTSLILSVLRRRGGLSHFFSLLLLLLLSPSSSSSSLVAHSTVKLLKHRQTQTFTVQCRLCIIKWADVRAKV